MCPTFCSANRYGCCRCITARHEGVGGAAVRMPRQSRAAHRAGTALTFNCSGERDRRAAIVSGNQRTSSGIRLTVGASNGERTLPINAPRKLPRAIRACVMIALFTRRHTSDGDGVGERTLLLGEPDEAEFRWNKENERLRESTEELP